MIMKLKSVAAPLLMAGAAAGWILAAPYAVADTYATATGSSIVGFAPQSPVGNGSGDANGGSGCTTDGTCGGGGPQGGGGCTADGACGHGGPFGGGGCVPNVGCFTWGQ